MSHLKETVRRLNKRFNQDEKQYPTKIDIFLTERCNLRCKFCNYPRIPPEILKQEMSDKKILNLIDEVCRMNIKVFGVLGGEPFVRKKVLLASMEKIKEHEIDGSLVTNGTLIEERDAKRIIKLKWDLIRFSIDGLKETHDFLRGLKGSFNKVTKSIEMFYKIKKLNQTSSPTIEVNFVLTNKNFKELGELIEKLSSYEINFVYVLPLIELTEEAKSFKIRESEIPEVDRWLKEAEDVAEELGVKTNIGEIVKKNLFLYSNKMEKVIYSQNEKFPFCFLPWYTMNINSNGSITPCAQWPKSEGVMLKNKSLEEIWFEDFERMREKIKKNLPGWCSRCCVPLVDENKEIRRTLDGRKD